MKRLSILIFISLTSLSVWAQTQIGGSESPVYINNGKVGVGTNSPTESLDVKGNLRIQGSGDNGIGGYLRLYSDGIIGEQANWIMYNMSSNGVDYAGGGLQFWNYPADDSNGCCNQRVIFYNNGNVFIAKNLGMGTSKPISKLDVNGSFVLRNRLQVGNANTVWLTDAVSGYQDGMHSSDAALLVPVHQNSASDLRLYITDDFNDSFSIWGNTCRGGDCADINAASQIARFEGGGNVMFCGNVGIGKNNPDSGIKLDVAGTIRATELKIEAQTADFVFEDNYQLRSLVEIEQFVQTNKHLPDIPSAKEMKEDGVGLAEMNKLLLQKIEELTLYVIQLKNENESQNSENKELIKRVLSLEKRIGKTTN
ncbi:hypothetical protein [Labilibaculum euxinus]